MIPDHTCISVPTSSPEEAHFLAALLNSAPAQTIIRGYVVLHPSPHVLEHVAIPRFDAKKPLHVHLSRPFIPGTSALTEQEG